MSSRASFRRRHPELTASNEVYGHDRLPFQQLALVEARKMLTTRIAKWAIGLVLAGIITANVIFWLFSHPSERTFQDFASAFMFPQRFILPILILVSTSAEWTHRTAVATFILEPRRLRVATARTIAAALIAATGTVGSLVLAAIWAIVTALAVEGTQAWETNWAALIAITILFFARAVLAVALALIFRTAWVALLAFVVICTAPTALGFWPEVAPVLSWIDVASALQPATSGAPATWPTWRHLVSSLSIGVVLPLAVGYLVTAQRDIE